MSKVDVMKFISWKEGYFYYDNERLEDILTELGRWYNFTVIYEDLKLKELRFLSFGGSERCIPESSGAFE
ncbi:MAG: FecR domain-containing protein [Butyricimonas paravirosa]